MLSYLNVRANIGLFHFSFSIRNLVPLLFTPPSPLIPIYHQLSRVENVFITCKYMNEYIVIINSLCSRFLRRTSKGTAMLEHLPSPGPS